MGGDAQRAAATTDDDVTDAEVWDRSPARLDGSSMKPKSSTVVGS
jgi:hypothetical protein